MTMLLKCERWRAMIDPLRCCWWGVRSLPLPRRCWKRSVGGCVARARARALLLLLLNLV